VILLRSKPFVFRRFIWHWHCTLVGGSFRPAAQALKIETESRGGRTTIRLIGHFEWQHIEELTRELQSHGATVVVDLKELMTVDLDVVRFLGAREIAGAEIVNCAQYVRKWIDRERRFGEIG
jgi:hypothetical protein